MTTGKQILTPIELFQFGNNHVNGIEFIFISNKEIETAKASQEE